MTGADDAPPDPKADAAEPAGRDPKAKPRRQPRILPDFLRSRPPRRKVSARRRDQGRRCVYCHDDIRGSSRSWCPTCKVALHNDCAEEVTGCVTTGCRGQLLRYAPIPLEAPETWGIHIFGLSPGTAFVWTAGGALTLALGLVTGEVFTGALFALCYATCAWFLSAAAIFNRVFELTIGSSRRVALLTVRIGGLAVFALAMRAAVEVDEEAWLAFGLQLLSSLGLIACLASLLVASEGRDVEADEVVLSEVPPSEDIAAPVGPVSLSDGPEDDRLSAPPSESASRPREGAQEGSRG